MIDNYLKNIAVIGAGGKMGSGIALLLLLEMTLAAEKGGGAPPTLTLIDSSESALYPLKQYLRSQLYKFAEKNIAALRALYAKNPRLISNEEVIAHFVERAMDFVNCSVAAESAKHAKLLFEAIVEDFGAKTALYGKLKNLCSGEALFFSNTSSIPLSSLCSAAGLEGRLIGFHFYNPPAVQRLLEIVEPEGCGQEIAAVAKELAALLKKTAVYSSDVAGFIGNGYFIREGFFALRLADKLARERPLTEAIYIVNRVAETFLIRPMGIFQLIDYIGIDVFSKIADEMHKSLRDSTLSHPLIDRMVEGKLLGGQHPDGSQKPGFFRYEGTRVAGFYDFESEGYSSPEEAVWRGECDRAIGPLPKGAFTWKALVNDREREEKLENYFKNLFEEKSTGARLAIELLTNYRVVAKKLVEDGVARSLKDVATAIETGFFHLYGPDAEWMQSLEKAGSR